MRSNQTPSYLHKQVSITIWGDRNLEQAKKRPMTHISLKSFDMASTSIRPVIFSWLAKCLKRVISRSALLAKETFSNTLVTNFMATVSPEMSSAAELVVVEVVVVRKIRKGMWEQKGRGIVHDYSISSGTHVSNHFPPLFNMKDLPKRWEQRMVSPAQKNKRMSR